MTMFTVNDQGANSRLLSQTNAASLAAETGAQTLTRAITTLVERQATLYYGVASPVGAVHGDLRFLDNVLTQRHAPVGQDVFSIIPGVITMTNDCEYVIDYEEQWRKGQGSAYRFTVTGPDPWVEVDFGAGGYPVIPARGTVGSGLKAWIFGEEMLVAPEPGQWSVYNVPTAVTSVRVKPANPEDVDPGDVFFLGNPVATSIVTDHQNNTFDYSGLRYEPAWRAVDPQFSWAVKTQVGDTGMTTPAEVKIWVSDLEPASTPDNWDLWVSTRSSADLYVWVDDAWYLVVDSDVRSFYNLVDEAQQNSNDGKISTYVSDAPPTAPLEPGDLWFDTSKGNRVSRWDGFSWAVLRMGDDGIEGISADKITSGVVRAGTVITVGDLDRAHTSLSDRGLTFYADPDHDKGDWAPRALGSLGSGEGDFLSFTDTSGERTMAIDDSGTANFRSVGADQFTYKGTEFTDLVAQYPRGIVYHGYTTLTNYETSDAKERGLVEFSFIARKGRAYTIRMSGLTFYSVTGDAHVVTRLRYKVSQFPNNPGAPTVSSEVLRATEHQTPVGNRASTTAPMLSTQVFSGYYDLRVRVLLTVQQLYTSNRVKFYTYHTGGASHLKNEVSVTVVDEGPARKLAMMPNNGGVAWVTPPDAQPGDSNPPADPVDDALPPQDFVTTWAASATRSFSQETGNSAEDVYGDRLLAGYVPDHDRAPLVSIAEFSGANSTGGETGKTITQALAGATVDKVELYVRSIQWYVSTSGGDLTVSTDGQKMPTVYQKPEGGESQTVRIGNNEPRWVELSPALAAEVISGRTNIVLGSSHQEADMISLYGKSDGSNGPKIRITYSR